MEMLTEVIPQPKIFEQSKQTNYSNLDELKILMQNGFVPLHPDQQSGIAIKTTREITD